MGCVRYCTLRLPTLRHHGSVTNAKRKKRPGRETQSLLRVEMAEPRKAESVRVKEAELKATKLHAGKLKARKASQTQEADRQENQTDRNTKE